MAAFAAEARRARVEDAPVRGGRGVRRRGRARGRARARSTPRGGARSACRRSTSSADPPTWLARVDARREPAPPRRRRTPLAPWRERFASSSTGSTAPVVVACSGGADSVALLALARDAGLEPVAVHVDHGLRPGSAARGRRRARRSPRGSVPGSGARAVDGRRRARTSRRGRATRATRRSSRRASTHGADVVLVGHTADDQAETVLLNVLRGAAARGLAGMAPRRGDRRAAAARAPARRDARRSAPRSGSTSVARPDERRPRVPAGRGPPRRAPAARRRSPAAISSRCSRARPTSCVRSPTSSTSSARAAWPGDDGDRRRARSPRCRRSLARRAVRRWLGAPPPSLAEVERVLAVARGERRARPSSPAAARVRRSAGQLLARPSS